MNPTRLFFPLFLLFLLVVMNGCESKQEQPPPPPNNETPKEVEELPPPPAPPVNETFDGEPQLSLFPRAGAFRPKDEDQQGLAYWSTFVDHLLKTSGVIGGAGKEGSRAWSIRSIKGIDSVAYFSPLAVKPGTRYRIEFSVKGDLPEKGEAGIGILEFDQFLWIGEQFTEALTSEHLTGSHEGIRLSGVREWEDHSFTFVTADDTHMVHLILFREGESDRKPVLFDDIRVARVDKE